MSAAKAALFNSASGWTAGQLHCAFVEARKDRFNHLLTKLPSALPSGIEIHTYNSEFVDALAKIKNDVPNPFTSENPLFVFIDPFGATGVPFRSVTEILNSPCSEVLINLDADGVGRIFRAKENANYEAVLNDVFGDSLWKSELVEGESFSIQCRKILHMYKDRLRALPGVRYVFEVEMRGSSDTLNYFLVFASKHPLGLMKMKEAMKKIAQDGSYVFADANVAQSSLFRFDEPEEYHMRLYNNFKGKQVDYDSQNDDITAFALNDTPFVNPKSMLVQLEREGLITAVSRDQKRKKGAFNEAVTQINFHGRIADGSLF